jgi:Short C-terminal domain
MAKLASKLSMAGVLVLAVVSAFASDTTYRDPRNPSFSVVVPDGWTAKTTNSGVNLGHGNSSVILMSVSGSRPAPDMLADLVSQFQNQAKNFHSIDKGECRFGGQQGVYSVFSGISPNGTLEVTRIVTMTNGQLVYAMILQAHQEEYEDEKHDLQRIQDSFAPEALTVTVDDRERLDALYAAGVINQQEYEARKKNLGASAGGSSAPPTNPARSESSPAGASPAQPESSAFVAPAPSNAGSSVRAPDNSQVQRYPVVHFALSSTMNWMTDNCVGWMTIGNGVVSYRAVKGNHGLHSFDFPVADIREAKRNALMGSALQAFHIRLKTGENYDFSLLDNTGQRVENPALVLDAIHAAMK